MRKCRGRIVASILALALALTSGGLSVLAEGENSQQPANVSEEQQEVAGQSETDPEQESQPGEETESTGKQPAEEQTTAGQSDESSSVAVSQWSWIDEDGILQEDNGVWGIGMPGASEENPLTQDALSAMLPSQVQAVTANGETVTLDITWDLSATTLTIAKHPLTMLRYPLYMQTAFTISSPLYDICAPFISNLS